VSEAHPDFFRKLLRLPGALRPPEQGTEHAAGLRREQRLQGPRLRKRIFVPLPSDVHPTEAQTTVPGQVHEAHPGVRQDRRRALADVRSDKHAVSLLLHRAAKLLRCASREAGLAVRLRLNHEAQLTVCAPYAHDEVRTVCPVATRVRLYGLDREKGHVVQARPECLFDPIVNLCLFHFTI